MVYWLSVQHLVMAGCLLETETYGKVARHISVKGGAVCEEPIKEVAQDCSLETGTPNPKLNEGVQDQAGHRVQLHCDIQDTGYPDSGLSLSGWISASSWDWKYFKHLFSL